MKSLFLALASIVLFASVAHAGCGLFSRHQARVANRQAVRVSYQGVAEAPQSVTVQTRQVTRLRFSSCGPGGCR
jgi:hypothetical protein